MIRSRFTRLHQLGAGLQHHVRLHDLAVRLIQRR
jgi:hypothetical protein